MRKLPLISRAFHEMTAEEFHTHVKSMYELRTKGKAKKPVIAEGLALSVTKNGALSIRYRKASRPVKYVTTAEIAALAKHIGRSVADTWNAFKAKEFLIVKSRIEAEKIHAKIEGVPWID